MTTRTRWAVFVSFAILLVSAGVILPAMSPASNCGGNSAALVACRHYILFLQIWENDHPGLAFRFYQEDSKARAELASLARSGFFSARLLARREEGRIDLKANKQIIMVSDRAYNNVPQRTFGRAPMTHAVAYSTGETGLISTQEFARLDLTGFVDLQTLANP